MWIQLKKFYLFLCETCQFVTSFISVYKYFQFKMGFKNDIKASPSENKLFSVLSLTPALQMERKLLWKLGEHVWFLNACMDGSSLLGKNVKICVIRMQNKMCSVVEGGGGGIQWSKWKGFGREIWKVVRSGFRWTFSSVSF